MRRSWFFLILLITPFGLAFFFWDFTSKILTADDTNQEENQTDAPQIIVERTQLTQFNNSGVPAHRLQSEKFLSEQDGGLVHVSEPIIGIDPNKSDSWEAHSKNGTYNPQTKAMQMNGDVVLIRRQPEDDPITISTEVLNYYPDKKFADSDSPVIIETTGHKIETIGMSVDFAASEYKLKSQVRSRHDPI